MSCEEFLRKKAGVFCEACDQKPVDKRGGEKR